MTNKSELTDFYYKSLYPILKQLDEERKHVLYRVVLIISMISFVFLVILWMAFNSMSFDFDLLIGAGFVYVAIVGFIYKFLIKDYTDEFKDSIIRPLITAIEPNLSYASHMHVPQLLFNRSELFAHPDKINGNDFVKGFIDSIPVQFSDIHAQKRHRNSKGHENYTTLFQGLFIVAEFHKNFSGKTLVLPDTAQKTFGNFLGSWLQSNNFSQDELVKMDNIEFEKEFVVYGSNQIEARYILSPSLMHKLVHLKKRSGHPVYFSFIGEHIHIAIHYDKDLFEPAVFKSLLEYKVAMEYVETLHMAIGIVEELKLNQKIWSKV